MNGDNRRAILEGILHAEHSTPAERLKAAELLGTDAGPERTVVSELGELSGATLDAELDGLLIVDVVRSILGGSPSVGIDPDNWPQTRDFLLFDIERRVAAEVADLLTRRNERLT